MTAASETVAKPVENKIIPSATVQAIPFRKDTVASTPEVFSLLVITLIVLGLFACLAFYARRLGWLDRWVGPKPQSAINCGKKIVILETQRISQKTVLYRISNGDNEYLLTESSMQIQLTQSSCHKEVPRD
jgi:hypothetical protein